MFFSCRKSCRNGSRSAGMAVFMTLFFGDEHRKQKMSTNRTPIPAGPTAAVAGQFLRKIRLFGATEMLRLGLFPERRPELNRVQTSVPSLCSSCVVRRNYCRSRMTGNSDVTRLVKFADDSGVNQSRARPGSLSNSEQGPFISSLWLRDALAGTALRCHHREVAFW